jgi:ATP-dependent DNA helicase RecG
MTDDELLELFRVLESDRVERKESLADRDRVRQVICAHANDLPNHKQTGVIFIGQRDDLSCAGLKVDDQLLRTLAGFRSEGKLLPFPTMHIRKATLDGCEVAVVEVEPSDNPPVRFDGRTWIRVGPRRAIATAEEERRLVEKRRWGSLPYDAHGVRGATLDDLDLRRFQLEYLPVAVSPEVLAENQRTQDHQLRALRLTHPDRTPTVTAILMLGIEPRRWIPGAYVQFLRIDGVNLTDAIVDQRELAGTLADQLRQIDELVRLNIRRPAVVGGAVRGESPDYPEEAIRQLVRNAVLHRTYEGTAAPVRITWFSDRIEIQSPGGPYGQVTKATFGAPGIADYRNPTIAEALKSLGFIERFGVGIPIARERLKVNGNPPPEFTVEDAHVLATVRPRP